MKSFFNTFYLILITRLALLWFHTIVRPFFGLDGSNSRSGADAAQRLIDSSKPEFAEASLFLFFQGRVNRLKVNMELENFGYYENLKKISKKSLHIVPKIIMIVFFII